MKSKVHLKLSNVYSVNFIFYPSCPVTISLVSSVGIIWSLDLTLWSQIRLFTCNQLPGAGSVEDGPLSGWHFTLIPVGSCPGAEWQQQLRVSSEVWFLVLGQSKHIILDLACPRSRGLVCHTHVVIHSPRWVDLLRELREVCIGEPSL